MSATNAMHPAARAAIGGPLVVFSAQVLALEVLLTRLLSYCVHTLLLYAILGVALLGFGAAGTLVALRPDWLHPDRLPRALAVSAIATVYAIVGSAAIFLRITPSLGAVDALSFAAAALLMLPFLGAGTVITLALAAAGEALPQAYAANLIGSGLGCFLPQLLLGPSYAEPALALLALFAGLSAWPWVRAASSSWREPLRLTYLGGLLAALACFVDPTALLPLQPEPAPLGQVAMLRDYTRAHHIQMRRRHDRSSTVGRIEIFDFVDVPGSANPYPFMFYAQDSSAGSTLVRWDGRTRSAPPSAAGRSHVTRLCTDTIYGAGYYRPRPKVLVIGLGGGPDLLCAVYQEAKHVDVVEINPRTVEAIRGPFSAFLGGAPRNPAVHFHVRDGRSFAHGARGSGYDLIQLSGTDTKQMLASGSLSLAENHLYTVEAFRDYILSLQSEGMLAIIRFTEAEALRLANTAVSALRGLGATEPNLQVAVVQNGILFAVLVRRNPFPPSEVRGLLARLSSPTFEGLEVFFARVGQLPFHEPVTLAYAPYLPAAGVWKFFAHPDADGGEAFWKKYPSDIEPTTDDRPFFFDIYRHDDLWAWLDNPPAKALRNTMLALLLLSVLLLLVPVLARRQALRGSALPLALLYFASLGLAYLFVEVWLLRRLAMYLGHETHGLCVVLASLLVSSGIGAVVGPRLIAPARLRALLTGGVVALLLTLTSYHLDALIDVTWGLGLAWRALIAISVVAPTGFCMGFAMPAGLSWARAAYPGSLAFCLGVNGFASVLATIAVLPVSLFFGYTGVLMVGAGLYAFSSLLALGMREELSRNGS